MLREILVNKCYGAFRLSDKAQKLYRKRYLCCTSDDHRPVRLYENDESDWDRCDPVLIQIVKELGKDAGSSYSNIQVEHYDDRYDVEIDECDGYETIDLHVREDVLRDLIRKGDEEEIVRYVMMKDEVVKPYQGDE